MPRDQIDLFVQHQFVQMMTEHIVDCSREFDGDLVEMLVLAVIGQAYLKAVLREAGAATPPSVGRDGLSAAHISETTGLPRETVRRKLQNMEQKRWVHQGDDRRWRLTVEDGKSLADVALEGLFERGVGRAKRLARSLRPYL